MFDAPTYPHERVLLRDVAAPFDGAFVDGPFGSNLKSDEYVDSGVRLIQLQNIGDGCWRDDNKKYITDLKFRSLVRHGAEPGDIAIAKMADPVARACLVPGGQAQYVVVADCIRLRVDETRFDPRYVVRAINSHRTRAEAEKKSIGSTRIRINLGTLKTVGCLVPPLPQQRAIANILDTLDTTIRQTEAIIEKLKQVKQGLLHDLLTRGIDANGELRPPPSQAPHLYMDSPEGPFPAAWRLSALDDVVRIIDCKHITPTYVAQGYAVVRPRNVKVEGLDLVNVEYVTGADYAAMTDVHAPRRGDIVLSRNASFGVPSYVDTDEKFAIGQDVIVMTHTTANTRFLFYCLQSALLAKQIARRSAGSTFGRINLADIRALVVPEPERAEQDAIAARLLAINSRIRLEQVQVQKLLSQRSGLMDDLLTGRVRVTALLDQGTPA